MNISLCRQYYLLIYARENFDELLVTAIVDTPPDFEERSAKPGFTIQRKTAIYIDSYIIFLLTISFKSRVSGPEGWDLNTWRETGPGYKITLKSKAIKHFLISIDQSHDLNFQQFLLINIGGLIRVRFFLEGGTRFRNFPCKERKKNQFIRNIKEIIIYKGTSME